MKKKKPAKSKDPLIGAFERDGIIGTAKRVVTAPLTERRRNKHRCPAVLVKHEPKIEYVPFPKTPWHVHVRWLGFSILLSIATGAWVYGPSWTGMPK